MTTATIQSQPRWHRLRQVLAANATTSALAGAFAAAAPGAVADLLGVEGNTAALVIRLVGLGLVVFAFDVFVIAVRSAEESLSRWAALVSAADTAWVAATFVVILAFGFSVTGQAIAVAVAAGVAVFAYLQLQLRRG